MAFPTTNATWTRSLDVVSNGGDARDVLRSARIERYHKEYKLHTERLASLNELLERDPSLLWSRRERDDVELSLEAAAVMLDIAILEYLGYWVKFHGRTELPEITIRSPEGEYTRWVADQPVGQGEGYARWAQMGAAWR